MAKRRRLIPSALGPDFDPDMADAAAPLAGNAFLRPGLAAARDGAAPPIAQIAGNAATQAALDEVTNAMARARAEGRMVLSLSLSAVDTDHLVRDRIRVDEEEMGHLMASIREHGQRTPIEVTDQGGARYGLISGWRRVQALQRLLAETGDPRFGMVLALLRRPAEASDAYIAMVEENEVRQGLSYYERARIAARAVDLGVFVSEKQALQRLFAAASRARRSKIGSFLSIYRVLDEVLRFPSSIPERLGLALAKALEHRPAEVADLLADLAQTPAADASAEQARLAAFIAQKAGAGPADKTAPAPERREGENRGGRELRPGVYLDVSGGLATPVLTLSGPAVDPAFRTRLEAWLISER